MKSIFTLSITLVMTLLFISCNNDDDTLQNLLSLENLSVSIDENSQANTVIGTFTVTQENLTGDLSFEIIEQSVAGAVTIDAQGQLLVADVMAFNFEVNPTITGAVRVRSGGLTDTATFTITINDLTELNPSLSIEDFIATLEENPEADFIIGTVTVNQTDLTDAISFAITSQSVMGAVKINEQGQLLVADATTFDFETNPTITGEISIISGTLTDTATFSISLNDVNEIPADAFVTEWELTAGNLTIRLPIHEARPLNQIITEYDFQVDWGDGTVQQVTSFDDPDAIHTYASPGKKTVIITGTLRGFSFFEGSGVSSSLLTNVSQWGTVLLGNSLGHFINCTNLTGFTATDIPDVSEIGSFERMFNNASSFTGGISNWDVSNVEVMTNMFAGATEFNEDISGWNVSKVIATISMFANAISFNQDISGWDVSSLLFVDGMFFNASSFNQDLSGWATDNVFSCDEFNGGTSALTSANLPTRGPCL
ncbi:BspA family leucine-rich repeat surface protein [Aquimarina algicola]|nr:BspA family leucine-rich repeat surface protein [Aquimarina algicola]